MRGENGRSGAELVRQPPVVLGEECLRLLQERFGEPVAR